MGCKCGSEVCAMRMARGLLAFCDANLKATGHKGAAEGVFSSYWQAAAALRPGQRVRALGSVGTGSPKRFVCV